jgi:hypothetical protein
LEGCRVTGDGSPALRRTNEPGPAQAPKSRGCRGGKKPQKSRRSPRRNAAFHVLQGFEDQEPAGLPGGTKVEGAGAPSRGGAVRSRRRSGTADEEFSALRCWEGLTRFEGSQGPLGRGLESSDEGRVQGFGPGRVGGSEARKEKALEGQKPRRVSAAGLGQPGSVRTDSQGEQSFEVGEAGGTERLRCQGPRVTGKQALWFAQREPIGLGGTRRLRESVGVGETAADKVSGSAFSHVGE